MLENWRMAVESPSYMMSVGEALLTASYLLRNLFKNLLKFAQVILILVWLGNMDNNYKITTLKNNKEGIKERKRSYKSILENLQFKWWNLSHFCSL